MDEPFWRKPGESAETWYARLREMDPVCLPCLLRQRRQIWLDMARQAVKRVRREQRRPAQGKDGR